MAIAMAAGLAITVASLWFAAQVEADAAATRRALGLALAVPLIALALTIGNVARLRFFSSEDIDAAGGSSTTLPICRAGAILQNTLEQAVLALGTYVLLARVRPDGAALLIALATLFALGRLLFGLGYARGAAGRALGFVLTFYPSVGALAIAVAAVITDALPRSA